ncbi:MAG: hypothetical protein ACRD1T_19480 [Acidimicrobiia bacterium]
MFVQGDEFTQSATEILNLRVALGGDPYSLVEVERENKLIACPARRRRQDVSPPPNTLPFEVVRLNPNLS